jgi:hypothetical protein
MAKAHTLRIGIGTPGEPYVSPWRIWAVQSEVYVATRQMAGLQKLSLHSSGVWTAAFTKESGVEIPELENRRSHRWERPPEFAPGWVYGPSIDVVRFDSRHDLPSLWQDDGKPTIWIEAPKVRNKLQISVLFAGDGSRKPADLGITAAQVIGALPLSNGEVVWVVAYEVTMAPRERGSARRIRDEEIGMGGAKVQGTPVERGKASSSVIRITSGTDGRPMIVQIPLGTHNFKRVDVIDRELGVDRG